MNKDIIISIKTVIVIILLILAAYIFYRLGPILAIVFFAALLVVALEPAVSYFKRMVFMNRNIPRSVAVTATYILFVLAILFVLTVGLPPVLSQARNLVFGVYSQLQDLPLPKDIPNVSDLLPQITNVSGDVLTVTFSLFSNVFTVLSVLLVSLYMSLDWMNLRNKFVGIFPTKIRTEIEGILGEVEVNIGHWVKGQLLLMLVVGVVSFFGLLIIGVDYPLALGLISGLLEIVPVLGPIVAAILAAIVGFSMSPLKGLAVIVLFLIIQQVENNILVPKVMQKVSGFSPLVIILALLVGSNLFGIAGAIVAVPITMILVIIFRHVVKHFW